MCRQRAVRGRWTGMWCAGAALAVALPLTVSARSGAPQRPGEPAQALKSGADEVLRLTDPWDHFSVDVSVQRSRVDRDGKPVSRQASGVTYRWVREQTSHGWKTTVTTLATSKPVVQGPDGPYELDVPEGAPVRMEDDEDGTPARFYDTRGAQIRRPNRDDALGGGLAGVVPPPRLESLRNRPAPHPRKQGREWAESFIVPAETKQARRTKIEKLFGKRQGQAKGLERFLRSTSGGQEEMLIDGEFNVPVELNVIKDGALVTQTTFQYTRGAGNQIMRRGMRVEQLVAAPGEKGREEGRKKKRPGGADEEAGARLVSEIEFSNVRLTKRAGAR